MSLPQPPKPAKLVVGFIMKDKGLLSPIAAELANAFGAVDMVSAWFPFDFTAYYEPEMGASLFRRVLAFQTFIEQNALVDIKIITNKIERVYSEKNRRRVNIDPGYMVHERFVLATGKNYTHRIYMDRGIYADLTLIYCKGSFKTLPWTYPDYAHHNLRSFLEQVRKKYVLDIKRTP